MRRVVAVAAVLAVVLGVVALPASAYVPPGGWAVVTGEDDAVCGDTLAPDGYSCDVDRLQAAVDEGGRIRLRGIFNLGEPTPATAQTVFITEDVVLRGEAATIYGGYSPLTIGIANHEWAYDTLIDWAFVFEPRVPVAVTVESIRFENFFAGAIYDLASTDLTVRDNEFVDAQPASFGGDPNSHVVLATTLASAFGAPTARGDISGKITIVGNFVDGRGREEAGGFPSGGTDWKGIGNVFRVTEAEVDVTVRDNVMLDFHQKAVTLDGVKGRAVVQGNEISNAVDSYNDAQVFQILEAGWGDAIVDFGAPPFPTLDPAAATTIFRNNEITSNHDVGTFFAVFDSDAVILKNNRMTAVADVIYEAIFLAATTDSIIDHNQFAGNGMSVVSYFEGSNGNLFKPNNDTGAYTSSFVDFFADAFSSGNTTHLEEGETYFDEIPGNNNWID